MANKKEDNALFRANISMKINDVLSELSPSSYTITEYDSIYSFYPKIKMMISDYEGVMNEYLAFINGTKIDINFGATESTSYSCPFTVVKDATPQQKNAGGTGGDVEIEMIHHYFYTQEKKCKAYQSNISDIIKTMIRNYKFASTDIEETYNRGLWYQPFVNDSEFINEYLLPFAYSNSATNTPFYCFIDSNNVFHFKSFYSMFNQKPLKKFEYSTEPNRIVADENSFSTINFAQLEMSKIRPFFSGEYYDYDKDGNYESKNDTLLDYMKTNGKYPVNGNSSLITSVVPLYDYDIKTDDTKNNNKGYMMNLHKECVLPDKVIINTVLDKKLVCGNLVNISLPMIDSNSSTNKSLRNSGTYLIESSYHIWTNSSAKTMLVCAKQNVNLNSDYRNKNRLFQN